MKLMSNVQGSSRHATCKKYIKFDIAINHEIKIKRKNEDLENLSFLIKALIFCTCL